MSRRSIRALAWVLVSLSVVLLADESFAQTTDDTTTTTPAPKRRRRRQPDRDRDEKKQEEEKKPQQVESGKDGKDEKGEGKNEAAEKETKEKEQKAEAEKKKEIPKEPQKEQSRGTPTARDKFGFQMNVRAAVGLPLGKPDREANAQMPGLHFPFTIDAGIKLTPHWFVGGYAGFGFGAGGKIGTCDQKGASCLVLSGRVGAEAQYHFRPASLINPWAGYGFGYEWTYLNQTNPDQTKRSEVLSGLELAHAMGGVDFRLHEYVGVGPFLDAAAAMYLNRSETDNEGTVTNTSIDKNSLHYWVTAGIRGTLFP